MKQFKNPFAINENEEIIYIKTGDLQNKDTYKNCYCPECGEKLIPRMGDKNKWHFSHKSNTQCNGNLETSLHLYAKEVIKKNDKILLPYLSLGQYFEFNKMEKSFIQDMHKWEFENAERITNQPFMQEKIYPYEWLGNEVKIGDFIPDCVVKIGEKILAIEIYVKHAVDKEKENKVKQSNIDMLEIDLNYILEDMQEMEFDLERYILFEAVRWWIYKTKVEGEENKLYQKIYNTGHYIVSEKYTKKELIDKRNSEDKEREEEEIRKRRLERQKEEKRRYALEHPEECIKKKINKFLNVIESYSHRNTNNIIHVCNIPVKGEYVFKCSREIWQKAIYDKFILNREGKNIQLAKINSWVEKYSNLEYFKEFDYSKDEIWDSKYDAVRNYLLELEKLKEIEVLGDYITKFGEIRVINGNKNKANLKIKTKYKGNIVCKNCGEIFDNRDIINKFYLTNFELDKECFQKWIKNYKVYKGIE